MLSGNCLLFPVLVLVSFCLIVPSLLGLLLSFVVQVMAQDDLKRMRAGPMDPTGRKQVELALDDARFSMALKALSLFMWSFLFLLLFIR